jgi:hypothetical protein
MKIDGKTKQHYEEGMFVLWWDHAKKPPQIPRKNTN